MAKVITKRDLAVIQCLLAWKPSFGGMTITRYTGNDPNAPEYKTGRVKVAGHSDEIMVKLKKAGDDWIPLWISVPEDDKFGTMYDVKKSADQGLTLVERK